MKALIHPLPAATGAAPAPLDIAQLVGAAAWSRLSPAIRSRFAVGHADVVYAGTMALHCSPAGRVLAWLVQWLNSPLVGVVDPAAPVQVRVSADGAGGVVWERQLGLAALGRTQTVRSTKQRGRDGVLEERTDGGLGMKLTVVEENGALVFCSQRYFYVLGRCLLPIPAWLTPGRCRVEHRDEGPGRFRFTLDMVHPVLGQTFHQTGVFADPEEHTA